LALAEAEAHERALDLFGHLQGLGIERRAVGSAIGVVEAKSLAGAASHHQMPEMDGAMMCAALGYQFLGIVIASPGALVNVVNVEKPVMVTPWHRAAALVSPQDLAPHGRRDGLGGAAALADCRECPHVGAGRGGPAGWLRGCPQLGAGIGSPFRYRCRCRCCSGAIDRADVLRVALEKTRRLRIHAVLLSAGVEAPQRSQRLTAI
jgi:hypothetical protein